MSLREWIVLKLSRSRSECLMRIVHGACEYGRARKVGYSNHWDVWCEKHRAWCNMGLDASKARIGGIKHGG